MRLSEYLEDMLVKRELKQVEFSRFTKNDVTQNQISGIIKGTMPGFVDMCVICEYLKLDINEAWKAVREDELKARSQRKVRQGRKREVRFEEMVQRVEHIRFTDHQDNGA